MRITPPFVFATGNADKARELLEQVAATTDGVFTAEPIEFENVTYGFLVTTLAQRAHTVSPQIDARPQVEETGDTLAANARIKAEGMARATGLLSIADDTGLQVDALDGAPGVYSARFAGPDASYADNVAKLLHELAVANADLPQQRKARFVTVIHVASPDNHHHAVEGAVDGVITGSPRGLGTFGYDPVFTPLEGDGRTFAEMTSAEKHELSHRGRAFRNLLQTCAIGLAPTNGE